MSVVTYTVYGNYPRFPCRDTDKTAITTRTDTAASWKPTWDSDIVPYANTLTGTSNATICADSLLHHRFLTLGLAGWIESDTDHHDKLLSVAVYLAQNSGLWASWTSRRFRVLALSYAYNFLRTGVITFSEANRKIIGDALISMCTASVSESEFLDGHTAGNQMTQLVAGITLYGESGSGYNYSASATTLIDTALGFWYGDTPGDHSHIEVWRYHNGGHWLGAWYSHLGLWKASMTLQAIHTGFVRNADTPGSLQIASDDYEPFSDEPWIATIGKYVLCAWFRGDNDYWSIQDTARISNPWYHEYTRTGISWLIARGGAYRKPLAWLNDQLNTYTDSLGQLTSYAQTLDVVLHDPSDTDNTATHPGDATLAIDKTSWFSAIGSYWYRNTWDYANACIINMESPPQYFAGHTHLNCGQVGISVKNDMVVLGSTGLYSTSDANADYGFSHHRRWYQQSIAHSGVPLIDDGSYTHEANIYTTSWNWTTISTGDGGQVYKMYGSDHDPANLTEFINSVRTRSVPGCTEGDGYDLFYSDLRNAYVEDNTEVGTSTERVRVCKVRNLVIHSEGVWPVILRIVQLETRLASMDKQEQWHSYNNFSLQDIGTDTRRCTSTGYRGTGKVVIDLYNRNDYLTYVRGGGPANPDGYAALQFQYDGVNWVPADPCPARQLPDLGRYTLFFSATTERTNEYFVELIQPMASDDSPLAYQWINEANWFGVRFSDTDHEYRVGKTTDTVLTNADTTPPAQPTGVSASPGNAKATVSWSPNIEADIAGYKVYYRETV